MRIISAPVRREIEAIGYKRQYIQKKDRTTRRAILVVLIFTALTACLQVCGLITE
jgi:hypothetical protein